MRRIPRELLERLQAAKADLQSPQLERSGSALARIVAWAVALWVGMDLYRFLMAEIMRPAWGMVRPWLSMLWIIPLVLLVPFTPALATSCTRGTDCYCDRVQGGDLNDTSLLACEDMEARTLYENINHGGGSPDWGPNYDDTGNVGGNGDRGFNSYWHRRFGLGVSGSHRAHGSPNPATLGVTCTAVGGSATCPEHTFWHPTNLWEANSPASLARRAILRNGDFDDEIAANGSGPAGAAGGGNGVFDGLQVLAHRVYPGNGNGFGGGFVWAASREIGITMAVAFPANVVTSGIFDAQWKSNEWQAGGSDHGMFMFHGPGTGLSFYTPFYSFMFGKPEHFESTTACDNARNAATITAGTLACDGFSAQWFPTEYTGSDANRAASGDYKQSVDWPFNNWGCAQAHYRNLGLSNQAWTVWFTGPSGIRRTIVDVSNYDGTWLQLGSGPTGMAFLAYSNLNDQGAGSSEVTYRFEDNIHIRAGEPVSCAQIGFGSESPSPSVNRLVLMRVGLVAALAGVLGLSWLMRTAA